MSLFALLSFFEGEEVVSMLLGVSMGAGISLCVMSGSSTFDRICLLSLLSSPSKKSPVTRMMEAAIDKPPSQIFLTELAFLPMIYFSKRAHSASTSGMLILLSISSVFILLCNFKGLSDFEQRSGDVLVYCCCADAKCRGCFLIGHLLMVMQL